MDPEGLSAQQRRTRVLIADDHTLFRSGLRGMLARAAGFEVVGEAKTGEGTVMKSAEVLPDIVLMDIQMPQMNGIEATRRVVEANPAVGAVMPTMFGDDGPLCATGP